MSQFDASRLWTIIAPPRPAAAIPEAEEAAAGTAVRELREAIASLRSAAGLDLGPPPVVGAAEAAPEDGVPIIVLNAEAYDDSLFSRDDGYAWRAAEDRVELCGNSWKGLLNGTMDFLGALGFRYAAPGFPPGLPSASGAESDRTSPRIAMERNRGLGRPRFKVRRLLIPEGFPGDQLAPWISWAGRNGLNGLSLPAPAGGGKALAEMVREARSWGMAIELVAPPIVDLAASAAVGPFRRRDLGRVVGGRRRVDGGLCATDPKTLALLASGAEAWVLGVPVADRYTVRLPGAGLHCSCPSCRAFPPEEQGLLLANAVADVLARIRPAAVLAAGGLGSPDSSGEPTPLRPRKNLTPHTPETEPIGDEGWEPLRPPRVVATAAELDRAAEAGREEVSIVAQPRSAGSPDDDGAPYLFASLCWNAGADGSRGLEATLGNFARSLAQSFADGVSARGAALRRGPRPGKTQPETATDLAEAAKRIASSLRLREEALSGLPRPGTPASGKLPAPDEVARALEGIRAASDDLAGALALCGSSALVGDYAELEGERRWVELWAAEQDAGPGRAGATPSERRSARRKWDTWLKKTGNGAGRRWRLKPRR